MAHIREIHSWFSVLYATLIRWAFQRLYYECAWTYDAVAWLVSRGLWRNWTLAALPYLQGRVLELGCGTGYVQHALALTHPDLAVGIDSSPQMLALTRRRLRGTVQPPQLAQAVAQALPFAAQSFDSVLATFPTEYVLHPATILELCRVLDSRGRLVIVDAATFTTAGLYERLIKLAYWLALLEPVATQDAPQRHWYECVLENAGFTVQVRTEQVRDSQVRIFVAFPPAQNK